MLDSHKNNALISNRVVSRKTRHKRESQLKYNWKVILYIVVKVILVVARVLSRND